MRGEFSKNECFLTSRAAQLEKDTLERKVHKLNKDRNKYKSGNIHIYLSVLTLVPFIHLIKSVPNRNTRSGSSCYIPQTTIPPPKSNKSYRNLRHDQGSTSVPCPHPRRITLDYPPNSTERASCHLSFPPTTFSHTEALNGSSYSSIPTSDSSLNPIFTFYNTSTESQNRPSPLASILGPIISPGMDPINSSYRPLKVLRPISTQIIQ